MMKAAVYYPGEGIRIDERPVPQPAADHLLIRVQAAGICGSDMHYYKDGHIGDWWIKQPHVLGHEFAGEVAAIGADVTGFTIGERVAIEPIIPCGACSSCGAGLYNLCLNLKFTGSPHTDGAFQEYVQVRPRFAHPIPDHMPFELAALVEPTSIAVHAVRRSRLTVGDSVAVIGAGPIGLLTLAVAKASGAAHTIITDMDEARLEMAQALGADVVLHAAGNVEREIMAMTDDRGVDVAFEAVGLPATIETALRVVRAGGNLTLIGVTPEKTVPFNLMLAQAKEVDIAPVYLGRDAFPAALELLASGRVNGQAIITHRFPLMDMATAMDTAVQRKDNAVKVIVTTTEAGLQTD
ncbi:MAG: NAD(P)-dependent alcohol dehydrogenase [Chloroflexota bacterium]